MVASSRNHLAQGKKCSALLIQTVMVAEPGSGAALGEAMAKKMADDMEKDLERMREEVIYTRKRRKRSGDVGKNKGGKQRRKLEEVWRVEGAGPSEK